MLTMITLLTPLIPFLVAQHIVETITLTGDDFLAADVNDDFAVNGADLLLIKRYIVGIITEFPGGTYIP